MDVTTVLQAHYRVARHSAWSQSVCNCVYVGGRIGPNDLLSRGRGSQSEMEWRDCFPFEAIVKYPEGKGPCLARQLQALQRPPRVDLLFSDKGSHA